MEHEPKALMGFWLGAKGEPFIDLVPISEIAERKIVGWELVAKETDFAGWLTKKPMRLNLQRNPMRRPDYGEQ